MAKKNTIIKIAKKKVILYTNKDINLTAKQINSFSEANVIETAKNGIVFK